MKSITGDKTKHPGGFPDIVQALRYTDIIASQAYTILRNAGLPAYENEKAMKMSK
jgi:hypothetical protein